MRALVLSDIRFVTADQPDKFLRMHLMAVPAGILLRHRALGTAVGDHSFLLRKFSGYPFHLRSSHGQPPRVPELTRYDVTQHRTL